MIRARSNLLAVLPFCVCGVKMASKRQPNGNYKSEKLGQVADIQKRQGRSSMDKGAQKPYDES